MAEPKTKLTSASVESFLNAIKDEDKRKDCWAIAGIMETATKAKPRMWGSAIVGFGSYPLKYADGRESDWPITSFSPRKANITLYIMAGFEGYDELLAQLGKHDRGKSCVYIKRLSDIHVPTLKKLIAGSVKHVIKTHS